jgi:ATP-dependent RNA helicase DDX27
MLFSATMTDAVEDLVELSLHEPVRLFVNVNTQVTSNLTQEFIRIRKNREHCREAIVLALCSRV